MTFREFVTSLVRVRDEATGALRPVVLHPEEQRLVVAMDARDAAGRRRYPTVIVSWPRKAGKSFVSGAIAVYMLVFDAFATDREVLIQASTKDQGRNAVYGAAKRIVRANPWLAARIGIQKDGMTYTDEAGVEHVLRVLPERSHVDSRLKRLLHDLRRGLDASELGIVGRHVAEPGAAVPADGVGVLCRTEIAAAGRESVV